MKTIKIERLHTHGRSGPYRQVPQEDDCPLTIDESCLIYNEDGLVMVYIQDFDRTEELLPHIKRIKFGRNTRVTGVASETKVFGYQPRSPLRLGNNMCKTASLSKEDPEAHIALEAMSLRLEAVYREFGPEKHAAQVDIIKQKILSEYVMSGSCYTSGVVNRNNPLVYHYDAGNFKGCWSAMLAYKQGIAGGNLALPDYNTKVIIRDRSLLLFDGQKELHGVTPIIRVNEASYRYTVVYYALEQLWRCLPYREEMRRAQVERTQTERKKAQLLRTKDKQL